MRNSAIYVCVLLVANVLGMSAASGQQGWYVKAGVGPAWTEDLDLESAPGAAGDLDVEFDVGVRFDFGGGYRFCEWFSAEFESGFIHNYIDEIGGAGDLDDTTLANIPLMANAIFEFPTQTGLTPFAGVGAGVSFSVLTIDDVGGLDGTESDAVFAYQGILGLRYDISEQWAVNLTYKYFRTTDPSWDVRGSSRDIEFEGANTHAFMAGFNLRF